MDDGFDSFEEFNNLYLQTKKAEDITSLWANDQKKLSTAMKKDEGASKKDQAPEEEKGLLGQVTDLLESAVVAKKQ